jgi:hypothetical protein
VFTLLTVLALAPWAVQDLSLATGKDAASWWVGALYDADDGRALRNVRLSPLGRQGREGSVAARPLGPDGFAFPVARAPSGFRVPSEGRPDGFIPHEAIGGIGTLPSLTLGKLAEGQQFNALAGATLTSADGRARLTIAPGAFPEAFPLSLTPLAPEALPAPLPLGWSPFYGLHLGPEKRRPQAPVRLELPAPGRGSALVAGLDPADGQWKRLEATQESETLVLSLPALGSVAVLVRDSGQDAPPIPRVGAVLAGSAPGAPPTEEQVELAVSPETLFLHADARVRLSARVADRRDLPSGTRVRVRIAERYRFLDGGFLLPPPVRRELVLYRQGEGASGSLSLATAPGLKASRLQEGRIEVRLVPAPAQPAWEPLTPAGGLLTLSDGAQLRVPDGGLAGESLLGLASDPHPQSPLPDLEGFSLLADLQLVAEPAEGARPWSLSIPVPVGYQRESPCLVAEVIESAGMSRYRLAGPAHLHDDRLVLSGDQAAQGWPGMRGPGRYLFLTYPRPLAFLQGRLLGAAGDALVAIEGFPLVTRVRAGSGRYRLALPLAQARVSARDLSNGAAADLVVTPKARDELMTRDLALALRGPALLTSAPVAQAQGVALSRL